ncbi:methyltransferase domain-containing protein [Salipiger sp.]|uniref:methyltransferase domain-containing protein n=1 Tax=Salipiger sp. TaxID=2078585 RepID=UPI003A96DE2A
MPQPVTKAPAPRKLRPALSRAFGAETLDITPFRRHPLVVRRMAQLKAALALAPEGLALEFGVFKGGSIRAMAHARPDRRFTGFDSFEGLPEAWERSTGDTYDAGHFALDTLPPVPPNVTLIKGFFEDTLDDWLAGNPGPAGFIHMDPDLYSACRFVLGRLSDRIVDGTVIVFDELCDWQGNGVYDKWPEGEWKALGEWLAETGFSMRILSRDKGFACAVQVFRGTPPKRRLADDLALLDALAAAGEKSVPRRGLAGLVAEAPNWLAGHLRLAEWQVAAGEPPATLDSARTLAGAAQDPDALRRVQLLDGELALQAGDAATAAGIADALLTRARDDVPALFLRARAARPLRDYETEATARRRIALITDDPKHHEQARSSEALCAIRPEFRDMQFSGLLVQRLCDTPDITSVLDVGSGAGDQARALRAAGKVVTELDYGESHYFKLAEHPDDKGIVIGNFLDISFETPFDCVLASHVVEHQPNVNAFLSKAHDALREGGLLAISVPPLKHAIVGGHLTLWNAGLMLYNLVLAGFDCRDPWVRRYGYNISVTVRKRSITPEGLVYDNGDIDRIAAWLPPGLSEGFDGDIWSLG